MQSFYLSPQLVVVCSANFPIAAAPFVESVLFYLSNSNTSAVEASLSLHRVAFDVRCVPLHLFELSIVTSYLQSSIVSNKYAANTFKRPVARRFHMWNSHPASNEGWHSRLVGGYCLLLAQRIRAANSRLPPLSLGCIATGGGRVLDWSPIFLGLNRWRASINRHSMGSFRATLSIYKESNNAPIFFKTDGERFAQPKTVKLLADCKYRLDIVFRPAKKMA